MNSPIKDHRLIFFDLETTGLNPQRGHRVIEIGAVAIENNHITDEFCSFVKTDRAIPKQATKIHNITDAMLLNAPGPEKVYPAFCQFLGSNMIIAHNIKFDLSFLQHELRRLGMGISNRTACTLEMSRRLFTGLPDYRLQTVARYVLGKVTSGLKQHRALDDARLTAEIWMAMVMR